MKLHRRFAFGVFLFATSLLLPLMPVQAPAAETMWRIGFMSPATRDSFHDAFFKGLKELGYVEGRNVILHSRLAATTQKRITEAAVDLAKLRVDVIVARGTQATLAAKRATATIPIIMTGSSDPVGTGLVSSLAQPGANVTGMSILAPDLAEKRLELLRRVVPGSRVLVLWNPTNAGNVNEWEQSKAAADRLKINLISRGAPAQRYLPSIQITETADHRRRRNPHRCAFEHRPNRYRSVCDQQPCSRYVPSR
jgi:putative ABC transport system substrate-binding protein